MPYLRTYVGPEDCARGFAAAVWTHALYDVWVLAV